MPEECFNIYNLSFGGEAGSLLELKSGLTIKSRRVVLRPALKFLGAIMTTLAG